jgi:hypothetical protein
MFTVERHRINLTGLPEVIVAELAWMAHWQAADGTRSSVLAISQLANILRRAISQGRPFRPSTRQMDWDDAAALQTWRVIQRLGMLCEVYFSLTACHNKRMACS